MNEKNIRRSKKVFYTLIVTSILILLMTFIGNIISGVVFGEEEIMRDEDIEVPVIFVVLNILTIIFWLLFSALGAILIFLTLKSKVEGKLKVFLLLTGASAVGFLISVILHNLIYGLFIYLFGENFWAAGDEPIFFIIAIIVCPISFLIGAIGSIVLFRRKGGRHSSHGYVRN